MDGTAAGGCLCGAVRYTARGPLRDVVVCHCGRCRRQHGHVGAYSEVAAAGLEVTGEVAWYAADERVRGFCPACGSSLFWRRTGSERVSVAAGSLDAPTGLSTVAHIFVASKGDYYELTDGLEKFPAGQPPGDP